MYPRSKSASGFVFPPVQTGSQMYPPGPNPLVDMYSPRSKPARGYVPHGPNPLADLDPPTKLCENIILDVLVEIDILSVPVRTKVCF